MKNNETSPSADASVNLCLSSDGYCACADFVVQSNAAFASGLAPPAPVEPECASRVSVPSSVVNTMLSSASSSHSQEKILSSRQPERDTSPDDLPRRDSPGLPRLIFAPSQEELKMHYKYAVDYFFQIEFPERSDNASETCDIEDQHGIASNAFKERPHDATRGQVWMRRNIAHANKQLNTGGTAIFSDTLHVTGAEWADHFMSRRRKERISFISKSVSAVTGHWVSLHFDDKSGTFFIESYDASTIEEAKLQIGLTKPHRFSVSEELWQFLFEDRTTTTGILSTLQDKTECRIHVDRWEFEVKAWGLRHQIERCEALLTTLSALARQGSISSSRSSNDNASSIGCSSCLDALRVAIAQSDNSE